MDGKSAIVPATSPDPDLSSDAGSQLSAVLFDEMQQAQTAFENMLKMISEIQSTSAEITEEVDKCKEWVCERKKMVEEEKENFQAAILGALELLNKVET